MVVARFSGTPAPPSAGVLFSSSLPVEVPACSAPIATPSGKRVNRPISSAARISSSSGASRSAFAIAAPFRRFANRVATTRAAAGSGGILCDAASSGRQLRVDGRIACGCRAGGDADELISRCRCADRAPGPIQLRANGDRARSPPRRRARSTCSRGGSPLSSIRASRTAGISSPIRRASTGSNMRPSKARAGRRSRPSKASTWTAASACSAMVSCSGATTRKRGTTLSTSPPGPV